MPSGRAATHSTSPSNNGYRFRFAPIGVILLAGLALRLILVYVVLPGEGFRDDVRTFAEWADVLARFGPGGFYEHALPAGESPGYLYTPGYLYVLWAVGALGDLLAGVAGETRMMAIEQLIKLPAIAADLAIAGLLFRATAHWSSRRAGAFAAAIFLFVPLTWYDSAVWGQVDAVGTLLLLVSLCLLVSGWSEPAVMFSVAAAVTKPQCAIGLVVVIAVLAGRHLLRPGTGPVPRMGRITSEIDRRLGGWFSLEQGPRRLVTAGASAVVVFLALVVPFDLSHLAPERFADAPLLGDSAGFLILVRSAAGYFPYLTVNAFNPWAFVGPTPLVDYLAQGDVVTPDTTQIGPVAAMVVGVALMVALTLVVATVLLLRNDRQAILVGFTVLALAFFILPTRSHERYLFPAIASAAALAATSLHWRWWSIALGVVHAANLHAVLTLPQYGGPGLARAPLANELQSPAAVAAVSLIQTTLFLLAAFEFGRRFGPWTMRQRGSDRSRLRRWLDSGD